MRARLRHYTEDREIARLCPAAGEGHFQSTGVNQVGYLLPRSLDRRAALRVPEGSVAAPHKPGRHGLENRRQQRRRCVPIHRPAGPMLRALSLEF